MEGLGVGVVEADMDMEPGLRVTFAPTLLSHSQTTLS
jgi:hypothetical protein